MRGLVLLCLSVLLAACSVPKPEVRVFDKQQSPQDLADWGVLFLSEGTLRLNDRVLPFDLNTPLFSDYAHKLRTVWVPQGATIVYADDNFEYPLGTIISKTFYYPKNSQGQLLRNEDYRADYLHGGLNLAAVQLIETRLLVLQDDGWQTLPYVWNQQQTAASLEIAGDFKPLSLRDSQTNKIQQVNYVVPDSNQCAGCHADNHTAAKVRPIGPRARHLNKSYFYNDVGEVNQLQHWANQGLLMNLPEAHLVPKLVSAFGSAGLDSRARAYLDINCGHCHNPKGAADTSGLFLQHDNQDLTHLGYCKPPVAAGRGAGDLDYAIKPGDADNSILVYRMRSLDPGQLMPELGRSIVHDEGVALISSWINAMPKRMPKTLCADAI